MPHAIVPTDPFRAANSSPLDINKPFNLHIGKRQQNNHQHQQQDLLQLNSSITNWVENSEMGNPDQFLSPDDAITGSSRRSRSRLSLSRLSLNPFSPSSRGSSVASSRTSANEDDSSTTSSPHLSPASSFSPGFSLSRTLSRSSSPARDDGHSAGYRSPFVNPSPATRRPRERTPPPAYSKVVTAASGPTLGAVPPYEASGVGAPTPAPTSVPVAAPAVATANSSIRNSRRTNSNNSNTNTNSRGNNNSNNRTKLSDRKDPLAFLSQFDTIFLIDDSMSMWGSCWEEAEAALAAIAPVCTAYDKDGVDVYFLNHMSAERDDAGSGSAGTGYRNVRSAAQVARLFRNVGEPEGRTTLTGMRLQRILQAYVTHYERVVAAGGGDASSVKPINIIVVTDGEPTDEPGDVIRQFAKRLDKHAAPPYQVGIQFFQVGDDKEASKALGRLDDDLRHSESGEDLRDMVDTVTFDGVPSGGVGGGSGPTLTKDGILKTVLGAVIRRLDKTDLNASNG